MSSEHEYLTHAQRAALGCTAGDQSRAGQSVTLHRSEVADRRPRITTWKHTFSLLALAAGFDGRERGQYEAEAWLRLLNGYVVADVELAIEAHYSVSRFPVMPADVIQIIEEGEAE